jgi:hypothetical protein
MLSEEEEELDDVENTHKPRQIRNQIFSGSNEQWTDKRIQEFNHNINQRAS